MTSSVVMGSSGSEHSGRVVSPGSPTSYFKPAPAEIAFGPLRFLITDRPNDTTIQQYIQQLRKHGVGLVVRVCEPTYNTQPLLDADITVMDMEFSDGSPPPKEVRDKWIGVVKETFAKEQPAGTPTPCIAVHCVAGLGRAPVMVALALMEAGMKYEPAVERIRERRRGAINQKQLLYLERYKPSLELKKALGKAGKQDCAIM